MRIRTEQLFQMIESLRRRMERHAEAVYRAEETIGVFRNRVERLERINGDLAIAATRALQSANDQVVILAQRVRRLENALEGEGRDQVHEEGDEQGR
jgi:16S rRNA G527 N7-methylase RsmG